MEQTEKTKSFIAEVNNLVESGQVKGYITIADKLQWDKTSMSNVMKGRRNVPNDVYNKFAKIYNTPIPIYKTQKEVTSITIAEFAAMKAAIKVLTLKVISLESQVFKKSFEKASLDLEKTMQEVLQQVLDQLRNEAS